MGTCGCGAFMSEKGVRVGAGVVSALGVEWTECTEHGEVDWD